MQVFRLVVPGIVDRVIGFESLPKRLLTGVRRCGIEGFPRHWRTFFGVDKNAIDPQPFYFLEYTMINRDKEKWQEISNYVRSSTDKKVRLLDKLEDMAISMAPDAYSQMTIEPEDITIIPIQSEEESEPKQEKTKPEPEEESPLVEAIAAPAKKRGRPKKDPVAA